MPTDVQVQGMADEPIPTKIVDEITEAVSTISKIVVDSPKAHALASNAVIDLDGLIKMVREYWKAPKEAAFKLHKGIVAKESEMLKPLEAQRKLIVSMIGVYLTEQDRIRQEEYRRLEAEQRQKEETERTRLLDEAAKAEAEGQTVDAEVLFTMAEQVTVETPAPPMAVIPQTIRTDNGTVSQRRDIEVTVTNVKEVLRAIIDGTIPVNVVEVSTSKIKQYIKLCGLAEIPGCSIKEIMAATFRRGRY